MKIYNVALIPTDKLLINGKGDSQLWDKATVLGDFKSPWNKLKIGKTEFRALWDGEFLFFYFKVNDSSVYIDNTDDSYNSINGSDRVELFFRSDINMDPYYCLEMDATPRIMDFKATPNKNFDFGWTMSKKDLEVASVINEEGFTVEGKISIASLKDLNVLNNGKIETGIFRAKYRKTVKSVYEPIWITWVDPKTDTPNFHTPTSFGILKLESN